MSTAIHANSASEQDQFLEFPSPPSPTPPTPSTPPPPAPDEHASVNPADTHVAQLHPSGSDISPAIQPLHRSAPSQDSSSLFDTNPNDDHFLPSPPSQPSQNHHHVQGMTYYTSSTPTKPNERKKKLRLFFSASDLVPTWAGARIRGAYAIIYMNESPVPTFNHFSHGSVITSETGGTAPEETQGNRSSRSSDEKPPKISSNGTVLGRTERAQLCGRDVEFCRHIVLRYAPTSAPVLFIQVYGVEGRDSTGRSHLVGTTSVTLEKVYSHRGFRVAVPLAPPPPPDDGKKRRLPPDAGKLRITAEDVTPAPTTYHLDIMCDGLRCARPWGNGRVKRAFYTIHVIATSDERCDDWVLLYRSSSVSMVKKKRFGGSMEYNYFSSRPLLATPGLLFSHDDDSENAGDGLLRKVQHMIKGRYDAQFFSMPSSSFALISPTRRLKLAIWEDHSGPTGANLVAESLFSMAQLRNMKLGQRLDMFVHSDIVGHATLKFEERCEAPTYFCLSIQMPDLVQ